VDEEEVLLHKLLSNSPLGAISFIYKWKKQWTKGINILFKFPLKN